MKIAILNSNLVNSLEELGTLTNLIDQTQKYVLDIHQTYMYYIHGLEEQCELCKNNIDCNSKHWYLDLVLFRGLFYKVEDDYNFEVNNATDITDKCSEYQINKLI